ncbi:MAG: lysylphosphatidylglycerol synthase transmembrane domain-containing protein [Candidatus Bathyarchaeia archaeon]
MNKNLLTKFFVLIIISLPIFLVYLYFTVGVSELASIFEKLDLRSFLLYNTAALIMILLSTLFYSMSWNKIIESIGIKIGLKKAFLYSWSGIFVDLITPFETVSGEILRIYLAQRETGEQLGKIVASVVAHRIIVTFMSLGGLTASSILLTIKYNVNLNILYTLLAIILCLAALLTLLFLASLKRGALERIINPILNFTASILKGRINLLETRNRVYINLEYFYSNFRHFSSQRRALMWAVFYGFLAWFLHLSVFFLSFYAINFLEITAKTSEIIIIHSIVMTLQVSPISLAPGLIEIVMTNLCSTLGFSIAISGVVTLLIRIATFWFPIIFGGIVSQWIGVKNMFTQANKNTLTC